MLENISALKAGLHDAAPGCIHFRLLRLPVRTSAPLYGRITYEPSLLLCNLLNACGHIGLSGQIFTLAYVNLLEESTRLASSRCRVQRRSQHTKFRFGLTRGREAYIKGGAVSNYALRIWRT